MNMMMMKMIIIIIMNKLSVAKGTWQAEIQNRYIT